MMTRSLPVRTRGRHFQFNNLLDLVRDRPFEESGVNFDPLTGQVANGAYRHLMNTNGAFIQDEWRAKPNLTLSLGIRWDDYGNPHPDLSKTPPEGNVFRGQGNDLNSQFANAYVRQVKATYNGRLNTNWSPRVGIAYNPDGNGKTLIKGGIGLYHNWIPLGEDNRIRQNPPGLGHAHIPRRRPDTANIRSGDERSAAIRLPIPHHSGRTVGCQGRNSRITIDGGRD